MYPLTSSSRPSSFYSFIHSFIQLFICACILHTYIQRRSEVMPNDPETMKHHPSAVDNLLVEQLIYHSKIHTLKKFLCRDFSCISPTHASRLVQELGASFAEDMDIRELSKKEIHQITRLLRAASFPKPSSTYLSPAGEYNLRLGIIKEINPDLVATHTMPPGVYEGHPFIVEAAVAVGGKVCLCCWDT